MRGKGRENVGSCDGGRREDETGGREGARSFLCFPKSRSLYKALLPYTPSTPLILALHSPYMLLMK